MKQEAEALRESRLKAKAIKAKAFLARVDHVAEKNDARKVRTSPTRNHGTPPARSSNREQRVDFAPQIDTCILTRFKNARVLAETDDSHITTPITHAELHQAELATQLERKLEAAAQKRERQLANRQFAAADATARAKSIALEKSRETQTIARRLSDRIFTAAHRRDVQLDIVASKAAFFNERAVRVSEHKRAATVLDARVVAAGIQSKQAAADYLRSLDLRLRQQRAALTNERAAIVVERQKLSKHIQPMVAGAKLRAEQFMASERRSEAIFDIQNKAHGFIRRAVVTCANNEVHNRRISEHKRVALEERLAAAERRKEELMLCGISMAGGGPSPTRPRSAARVTSPALSESQALALRVDGVSLTPPNDRRARPASAIGVMNTTHVMNAVHARPVTARGLTLSDAHDSVTSEDDLSESGVVVFRTPKQTSRPVSRETASTDGGSIEWTHVSAPVSPTASSA